MRFKAPFRKQRMDKIAYLNTGAVTDVLFSKFQQTLNDLKQARATPDQWAGTIKSFTQKGVKQSEVEDSGVLEYLATLDPKTKVEKADLLTRINRRQPIIKRVDLGRPQYANWVSIPTGATGSYTERLYILSSEGMKADDEMEDLQYQIEELGFNPAPLLEDPQLVDRYEARIELINSQRPAMFDFKDHHHSKLVPKHGTNLMAHSRFTQKDGLFFIQEIQSDWAQKGRRNDWSAGYPKAPFVTNTEQWAGLVVRDMLNTAAHDQSCNQVAWIKSTMRNGGNRSAEGESDDLAFFYDNIVRKLVEKAIGKSQKPSVRTIVTKQGNADVLGFEMTDEVRKELMKAQPMYSRDALIGPMDLIEDPERTRERAAVVRECETMLGDARTIRFTAKLYDVSQGIEVAGRYLNQGIALSLRAKNMDRAGRHEMWHFADEHFLYAHERRMMRMEFSPGTALNERTVKTLTDLGLHQAARQCFDHKECAAHAFSLWMEGRLEIEEKPRNVFWAALKAIEKFTHFVNEKVFQIKINTPEDLFIAMKEGALSHRHQQEQIGEDANRGPSP